MQIVFFSNPEKKKENYFVKAFVLKNTFQTILLKPFNNLVKIKQKNYFCKGLVFFFLFFTHWKMCMSYSFVCAYKERILFQTFLSPLKKEFF